MRPIDTRSIAERARRFSREEDGALTWFAVVIFMLIIFCGGLAVDIMHHEYKRTRLQGTLDRAVLAAADLQQTASAQTVVDAYLAAEGLQNVPTNVTAFEDHAGRRVTASSSGALNTLLIRMLGFPSLQVNAAAVAQERVSDIEVTLVLDMSGSMNQDSADGSTPKIEVLESAVGQFVRAIIDADTANTDISVSIVPFAEQVVLGDDLISYFLRDGTHDHSSCISWSASDFETISVADHFLSNPTATPLRQTMPIDPWDSSSDYTPEEWNRTCPDWSHREIMLFENQIADIDSFVSGLTGNGNTSIDIGVKWGLATLDPSFREIVTDAVNDGGVTNAFAGRPFDYTQADAAKVLVVMSDGMNTSEHYAIDAYRSAQDERVSDVFEGWRYNNGWYNVYSSYFRRPSDDEIFYYWHRSDVWQNGDEPHPENWFGADGNYWTGSSSQYNPKELSWPDLWHTMSARAYFYDIEDEVQDALNNNAYASARMANGIRSHNRAEKDARLSDICAQGRTAGVTIYTIAFEAPQQGIDALEDCAGNIDAHSFDVDGLEMHSAFQAIAQQLNALRLIR
ncbi:MAG: pilus assembly protein TadG-related protein [Hasllibacter sp.]